MMALSLDDVQNIKFRMTERTGYKTIDVDEFVDEVEASFEELYEANANLNRQLAALKSGEPDEASSNDEVPAPSLQAPTAQQAAHNGRSREILTVTSSSEASAAVTRLVQMSTEHAESVVAEAEAEAARIGAEADQHAQLVTADATARAERVETQAQSNAEQVRSRAQSDADQLDQQTHVRRQEMFADLERERGELAAAVAGLRAHERDFRQALTEELSGYIEALSGSAAEPSPAPQLPNDPAGEDDGHPSPDGDQQAGESAQANGSDPAADDDSSETAQAQDTRGDATTGDAGEDSDGESAVAGPATAGDIENAGETKASSAAGSKTPRLDALLHGKS
jgi:DivIVA domain-containing protein